MAKLLACAVRDLSAAAFNRPFFVPTLGLAIRSFEDEVARPGADNIMARHPKDFALFHIGTFDEDSGILESLPIPQRLADAETTQRSLDYETSLSKTPV